MDKSIIYLFFVSCLTCGTSIAQHSIRADFPNGKNKGVKFESFTKEQWDSSNYASQESMKEWQDRRYGMFIHFGITSKALKDISWGSIDQRYAPDSPGIMANGQVRTDEWTQWYKEMKLNAFDAKSWVKIARDAGFKYIVITTKHHEGFHMWDTAFSDFKITKAPFGRDLIKELVDACHEAKMPVGFYFAQREWYHPDYQPVDLNKVTVKGHHWTLKNGETSPMGPRHAKYLEYQKNVIQELCTKYGKIDIWWWDAVSWGGMFTKEMWDSENMTRMIRQLQPGIVINNRASIPGDFDTPECHLGDFQTHRPWETCIPLSKAWCYTGEPAHSFDHIIRLIVGAAYGNGNLLISWGPKWDGEYEAGQTARLMEIGSWLKLNGESIYGTRGGPWKPSPWGGTTRNGKTAYVHLFSKPQGELKLQDLPGKKLIKAEMLVTKAPVQAKQEAGFISLLIPAEEKIKGDLVVALHFDESIDSLVAIEPTERASTFAIDTATYGKQLSHKNDQSLGMINLGEPILSTGLVIRPSQGTALGALKVSVSDDSKVWTDINISSNHPELMEYPITQLVSGALVPGKKIQFIRIDQADPTQKMSKFHISIYGKEK
jgi:alpha-L-fucosidase